MAVVHDTPTRLRYRGRDIWRSHLMSDQAGVKGTRELLAVAKVLSLRSERLQHAGTAHEHFDLVGERVIDLARRLRRSREIPAAEAAAIVFRKFHQELDDAQPRGCPYHNPPYGQCADCVDEQRAHEARVRQERG